MADSEVSIPSPTIKSSPRGQAAPPRQGPSIIFCGSTGALPKPSTAESAVNCQRQAVDAASHERHHGRPAASRRMPEPRKADRIVGELQSTTAEISLDYCAYRATSRLLDLECSPDAIGMGLFAANTLSQPSTMVSCAPLRNRSPRCCKASITMSANKSSTAHHLIQLPKQQGKIASATRSAARKAPRDAPIGAPQ